jgi:hypothetical protein
VIDDRGKILDTSEFATTSEVVEVLEVEPAEPPDASPARQVRHR